MCLYERNNINAAKSRKRIVLAIYVKKVIFKVILGNACVGGENLVPTVVPDICWLILKTVL